MPFDAMLKVGSPAPRQHTFALGAALSSGLCVSRAFRHQAVQAVREEVIQVAMWGLCLLVLLASTAHVAQEPMVAHTRVAIGLAPLQSGAGAWLIRPKTWVGVEFNALEWSWDKLQGDVGIDEGQRFLSFDV